MMATFPLETGDMSLKGAIGLSNNIMISCIICTFSHNLRFHPLLVRGLWGLVTTTHVLLGLLVIASFSLRCD